MFRHDALMKIERILNLSVLQLPGLHLALAQCTIKLLHAANIKQFIQIHISFN